MLPDNLSHQHSLGFNLSHQHSLGFLSTLAEQKQENISTYIQENEKSYQNCLSDLQSNEFWKSEDKEKLQNITTKLINSSKHHKLINKIITLSIKKQLVSTNKALHRAIKNRDFEKVKFLLELGADINAPDESGIPAFYYLIGQNVYEKQTKVINELIDFFLNHPDFHLHFNQENVNKFLIQAFIISDIETCLKLINKGVSSDAISSTFSFAQDFNSSIRNEQKEKLLEGFRKLCNQKDLKNEKIQEHLFQFWINPMNLRNVNLSAKEWNQLLDALVNTPNFIKDYPNLFTLIINHAARLNISLEKICECLDVHPNLKSYHGKQFMHAVIQNGNLALLKELIKRGVNPNDLYGSPIQDGEGIKMTPLHHAMLNHQRDIAVFLTQNKIAPVSLQIHDGKDQTILQNFLDKSNLLETHSLMISWLIDQPEIDIEMKSEKGQTLLSLMCKDLTKNVNWPLIAKLLEKGASLDAKTKTLLFNVALQHQQLSLAILLLKQAHESVDKEFLIETLINGLNYNSLTAMIEGINQGWAQSVLEYLVSKGLKLDSITDLHGNTLLDHVFGLKNYQIAAFLISQGSIIQKKGLSLLKIRNIDPDVLLNYAKELKKGSSAEQALRRELSIKNLGHLLGDSFLKKMKSIEGESLEGNFPSVSVSFMYRILNLLTEKNINISNETKERLKTLSLQFEKTLPRSIAVEDIMRMNPNDPHLATTIEKVADSFRSDLKKLKPGDRLLIPHGWSGSPAGHATMIACRKTKDGFVFDVINTGAGGEFHLSQKDQAKQYMDTVHSFFILEETIQNTPLIEQIFTPKFLGGGVTTHRDRTFDAPDLYVVLQPYTITNKQREILDIPLNSAWMGTQLSGTCSFRCLEATLLSDLETEEYKTLIPYIKELVLTMAFDLNQDLIKSDPPLAKIMSESAPRFFTHVIKSIKRLPSMERTESFLEEKAQDLERLEKLHKGLKEKLPSRTSSNPSLSCSDQFPSQTEKVQQSLISFSKATHKITPKSNKLKALPLPSFDFTKIETVEQLANQLNGYVTYLEEMKKNTSLDHSTTIFLINMGSIFIEEKQNTSLLSSLEKNPEICLRVLHDLETITVHYFEETGKKSEMDGSRLIALQSALSAGWVISKTIDKATGVLPKNSLENYNLNIEFYLNKVYYYHINLIYSPEMIENWAALYNFMVKNEKENAPILFQFDKHGQMPGDDSSYQNVYLRSNSGEYEYAEAHISTISEEGWKECNLEYEKQLKDYPSYEKVNPMEWKINWLYVKGKLPEHFLCLRHIAMLAHIESPYTSTQNRSANFEFSGPWMLQASNTNVKRLMITFSVDGNQRIGRQAQLLLKPEIMGNAIGLPKEKGNTHFWAPNNTKPPYNFVRIHPYNQNTILTTTERGFQDLVTLRTLYSDSTKYGPRNDLPFTMLIDYFNNDLQELAKPEARIIFNSCINQFLKLRYLNSPLKKELIDFLNLAINHYDNLVLTEEDPKQSFQALLFLQEQKQQILRTFISREKDEKAIQSFKEELLKTRKDLHKLRLLPICNDPYYQQHLCLILLDSFNKEDALTNNEAVELIQARADLARLLLDSPPNPQLFPSLWRSAEISTFKHKESIQTTLQKNPEHNNRLFNHFLEQLGVNIPGKWNEDGFPIYSYMFEDTCYQFNVLSGEALKNGNAFSTIRTISKQALYKELFSNEFIVGTKTSEGIESQDQHGNIRFLTEENWETSS